MKDRTYHIEFDLFVTGLWIDDGLCAETLARRIKGELPGQLQSCADGSEIVVRKIKVVVAQRRRLTNATRVQKIIRAFPILNRALHLIRNAPTNNAKNAMDVGCPFSLHTIAKKAIEDAALILVD